MKISSLFSPLLCVFLLIGGAGCVEVDLHVKINEDGSATVTEKLGYSQEFLDLASTSPKDLELLKHSLTKEGATERMKQMGQGVEMVSHEEKDHTIANTLYKESVTVYKIPDINNLQLSAPFPQIWTDPNISLHFVLEPCYKRTGQKDQGKDVPGYMAIQVQTVADAATPGGRPKREPAPPASAPADMQRVRELLPLVQEMLRGATIKLTVESYNVLLDGWSTRGGMRRVHDRDNTRTSRETELINVAGQNRDEFDRPILGNEDTVLEFLRGDWNGPHIRSLLWASARPDDFRYERDSKIPLLVVWARGRYVSRFLFAPSVEHYQKYFAGKTFDDPFSPPPPRTSASKESNHASE